MPVCLRHYRSGKGSKVTWQKKKDERFVKVHEEGTGFGWLRTVWVDKQTGVNYLFVNSGYAGGMTVLLGADGKPVIAPVPNEYPED